MRSVLMVTATSGKTTWNDSGTALLSSITSSVVAGRRAPDQFMGLAQNASPPDPVHILVSANRQHGNRKIKTNGQYTLRNGRYTNIILQNILQKDRSQYHNVVRRTIKNPLMVCEGVRNWYAIISLQPF